MSGKERDTVAKLLASIDAAVDDGRWERVAEAARKILALDAHHTEARAYLRMATRRKERAVPQCGRPDLAAAAHTEAGPETTPGFVGRRIELERLWQAVQLAARGPGRLHLIAGEPGIGKTRLAEELAEQARRASIRVLWGRCYEEAGIPAYWPWQKALEPLLGSLPPADLARHLGAQASAASAALPQIRSVLPDIEPYRAEGPEQDAASHAFRVCDAVIGLLASLSEESPFVVVLDDLHWADTGSLRLLLFLSRQLDRTRLFVLGAYRDVELDREHPLAAVLGELARERLFERHLIRGWSESEVGGFLDTTASRAAPPDLAAQLHEITQGNPLFVRELVHDLSDHPEAGAGKAAGRLPEGIREVIGRRLQRLPPDHVQMLRMAAVIGQEIEERQLRAALDDWPEERLLEALGQTLRAHILEELPGVAGKRRFVHALVRETIMAELTLTEQVRAHGRIAQTLEKLYGDDERAFRAPELLRHYGHAQAILGGGKVAEYALLAGRNALEASAYEHALACLTQGLEAVHGTSPDDIQAELHLHAARAAQWLGQTEAAREHLGRSVNHWERTGSAGRLVTLLASPSTVSFAWLGFLERALELAVPDSKEHAVLLAVTANLRAWERRGESSREPLERALRIAAAVGDLGTSMLVHCFAAWSVFVYARWEEVVAHGLQAARIAERAGSWLWEIQALYMVADVLRRLGRTAESRVHTARMLRIAEERRDRYATQRAAQQLTGEAWYLADWDLLRSMGDRSRAEAHRMGQDWHPFEYWVRVEAELWTGNPAEATRFLEQLKSRAASCPAGDPYFDAYTGSTIAESAALSGDTRDLGLAEAYARRVLESPDANPAYLGTARAALAWIAWLRRDVETARGLCDDPELLAQATFDHHPLGWGTTGRLALLLGRVDEGIHRLRAAWEASRVHILGHTWAGYELGQALLECGAPSDRTEAVLREALDLAARYGMSLMVERVEAALGRLRTANAGGHPAGLTEREVEVTRLLASGKSDKEIAHALHISTKTVSNHVGNILRKTGTGNRTEAALYAARHGVGDAWPAP